MIQIHSIIKGSNNLPICIDISYQNSIKKKPLVIFCHGFKGFKDWGAWNLVSNKFAKSDFIFLKFNFSHNGTSEENKKDFVNLKAFSENNYSKELEDLQKVIDWTNSQEFPLRDSFSNEIFLIGHSRGGGAVLVKTLEEKSVLKTCTWASIDSYDRFGTELQIQNWEKNGEHIFINGRTGQKMPIKFQFYSDYKGNINRLDIEKAVNKIEKPLLFIHGKNDPAVVIQSARNLYDWANNADKIEIENADHVFGSKHPYGENELPIVLDFVVEKTIEFFKK